MPREERLLTSILKTGNLRVALAQKIGRFSFKSPVNQAVFQYVEEHFRSRETAGQVPTLEDVKEKFPNFEPEDTDVPLETLCTELRNELLKERLNKLMLDTQELAELNPAKALRKFRTGIFSLSQQLEVSEISSLADATDVLEDYARRKSSGGVVGIPFPWPTLTKESGGLKPGELSVIYGRSKSMKTWLLLDIAAEAFDNGYRVLFVTTEMVIDEIKRRLAVLLAELDYARYRAGALSPEEEMLFQMTVEAIAQEAAEGDRDIVIFSTMEKGVDQIATKVDETRPDLVLIDSIYHLEQRDWRLQSDLITSVKGLAKDQNVPVVVTTQANRSSDKDDLTRRLSFSDAYAQIADYLLHVDKVVGYHQSHPPGVSMLPLLFIYVAAARDFTAEGFLIEAFPAVYFREAAVFQSMAEYQQAMVDVQARIEQTQILTKLAEKQQWTESIDE